jgi:hypothetical protein
LVKKRSDTLEKSAHLIRAKNLLKNGRYQKFTIKLSQSRPRFNDVDSIEIIRLDGAEWLPYFDTLKEQLVFGYVEKINGEEIFHYLSFMAFDYFYNAASPFVWDDTDEF